MTFLNDPTTGQGIADAEAVFRDGSGLPRPVDATHGMPIVNLDSVGAAIFSPAAAMVDAASNPTVGRVGAMPTLWNGATWDLQRNNQQGTLLASAARTTGATSPTQTNYNARGVVVYLDISVITGGPGLGIQAILQVQDPVSGNWGQFGGGTGLKTVVGTYGYGMYPGAGTVGGGFGFAFNNAPLPRNWRMTILVSDATPYTYSLSYQMII